MKEHGMPLATGKAATDMNFIDCRAGCFFAVVTGMIAEFTSGDDVVSGVLAPVLAGPQVFSGALKTCRLFGTQLVFLGKIRDLAQPHRCLAVKAAAVLALKSGMTVFGYSLWQARFPCGKKETRSRFTFSKRGLLVERRSPLAIL